MLGERARAGNLKKGAKTKPTSENLRARKKQKYLRPAPPGTRRAKTRRLYL